MIHNYVNFTYYEDPIICKKFGFHVFWQAHFNMNIVLTGTNSDCGGLNMGIISQNTHGV